MMKTLLPLILCTMIVSADYQSHLWLRAIYTGQDDGSEAELRGELTCGGIKKPIYVNLPVNANYNGNSEDSGYYLAHIDCPRDRFPQAVSVSVYEEGGTFSRARTLANWWLDPVRDRNVPVDGSWHSTNFYNHGYHLRARWSVRPV